LLTAYLHQAALATEMADQGLAYAAGPLGHLFEGDLPRQLIREHADKGAKDVPTCFDGCGGVGDLAIRTAAAAIHVAGRHSNDFMRLRLRSTITHRHFIEG
jgi:hypothetical protein